MQIQHMDGYWNAVWGAPAAQADGPVGARSANTPGGASGAPVTQNGLEDAASAGGGNPVLQALAQALKSLASTTSPPPRATPAPAPDHEISSEERTIAGAVRHLVHALFEDVRAENLLAPSSGSATGSSAPAASFASGLTALISQVQSGSAPANVQRAFDALVANLSDGGTESAPVSTATTTPSTAAASASTAAPAATLNTQGLLAQFLANLQTNLGLGYGGSTGTPAQSVTTGVMVNTAA